MDKKEEFLKIFANLPLNLREEVILVVDEKPISWNVAYLEVAGETKQGRMILEKLEALKII